MARILLVLAWLTIPAIVGGAVGAAVEGQFDDALQTALAQKNPGEDISGATVGNLCSHVDLRRELGDVCSTVDLLALMQKASVLICVIAILLTLGISAAGSAASHNRALLLTLFKPGLYLTMGATSIIVILNAALLFGAIWFGESALIGRVHVGIMVGLAIGALIAVVAMIQSTLRALEKSASRTLGKIVSEKDAPELWGFVRSLAERLKTAPPTHIVVGLDANFFVTEARVKCLDGIFEGRTLYISLPLARILTRNQLAAVIGHEFGHFIGDDTRYSLKFYPIYKGASDALTALNGANGEGQSAGIALARLPAIAMLSHFLESFAVAESGIGRERELAADKIGASLSGNDEFAKALIRIHALSPVWDDMQELIQQTLAEGKSVVNASSLFAQVAERISKEEALKGIAEARMTHPTDSHPTLQTRLQALSVSFETLGMQSLSISGEPPAATLISEHERIEQELTEVLQAIYMHVGAVPPAGDAPMQREKRTPLDATTCVGCNKPIDPEAVEFCIHCRTPVEDSAH